MTDRAEAAPGAAGELLAEADAYLARLAAAALPALSEAVLSERDGPLAPGTELGAYRVVRELDRGGMGTVHEAVRADGQFERRVAIKVLRRGLDTDDVIERFFRERQILASLTHPGIANLIDGGATGDGRPYLVMELVEGEPIDVHCDRRRMLVEERLALFLGVSEAVEYAHRHLVVHRDLKPSNILVTADGEVRLLDFGIAKLLDAGADPGAATLQGTQILTPAFASPEQLRGEAVTTASDVFQLGLLLCLLLSGRLPPGRDRAAAGAMSLSLADPPAPSSLVGDSPGTGAARGLQSPQLRRRLRGDLDAIVARALRPEAEQRYPSVLELAEDVRRYLAGHAVGARRGSRGYRARKLVARHRTAVAAGLAFAVMLGAYVVAVARERDRARTEALKAEQVKELLLGMFSSIEPDRAQGEVVTVREALDEGVRRVADHLTGQPEVEAELLSAIGQVYFQLGLYREAAPVLQRAVSLHEANDAGPALVENLLRLSDVQFRSSPDSGMALLRRAVQNAERVLPAGDPMLARALVSLAHRVTGGERTSLLERALRMLRGSRQDVRADLAQALTVMAYSDPTQSVQLHTEALTLRRDLYGGEHTAVALSLADLALALEAVDPLASDTLHAHAIQLASRLLGPSHTYTLTILNNHAGGLRDRGEFAAAEPLYREILARRQAAYPLEQVQNSYPMHGLAWVLAEQGKTAEAEPLLRRIVATLERELGEDDFRLHVARATLGRCLAIAGQHAEAETLLLAALGRIEETRAPEPHLRQTMERLAALYRAWHRPAEAERYLALLAAAA